MNTLLRQRFLDAPHQFLSSLSSGCIDTFAEDWALMQGEIQEAIHKAMLHPRDIQLAHASASRIDTLGTGLANAHTAAVDLTSSLLREVESVFAQCSLVDRGAAIDIPNSRSSKKSIRTRRTCTDPAVPPYIASAYSWLISNLHDPYPSLCTRRDISRQAGTPLRKVDAWFKDIRKCIGWVTICKSHFQSSRTLATQVAYQVLVVDDGIASVSNNVRRAFLELRLKAATLYEGLAAQYSQSPSTSTSPIIDETFFRLSPTPSLVSFSSDDSDNEDIGPFFKCSVAPETLPHEDQFLQFPSCQSSSRDPTLFHPNNDTPLLDKDVAYPSTPESIEEIHPLFGLSKKRKLSDSSAHHVSKRCRNVGPRLQAVSDPLPRCQIPADDDSVSKFLDETFNFSPPPFDTAATFESKEPMHFEVFNSWDVITSPPEPENLDLLSQILSVAIHQDTPLSGLDNQDAVVSLLRPDQPPENPAIFEEWLSPDKFPAFISPPPVHSLEDYTPSLSLYASQSQTSDCETQEPSPPLCLRKSIILPLEDKSSTLASDSLFENLTSLPANN